jgi:succinate dehydrogenase / fumarate reductase cytochrome b subunit
MRRVAALYSTTVGKKFTMAITGAILFVFVVVHMLGNLKAFWGPDKLNHYAEGLRSLGAPFFGHGQLLWLLRIVLLACVGLHMLSATQLTLRSWAARPVGYKNTPHLELSYSSRTMRWGGVIIGLYVVYHLMHFTWGNLHPQFVPGDVYANLITGFRSVPVVAVYLVALVMLMFHLYHGLWSALQTVGVSHPEYDRMLHGTAAVVAVLLFVGFAVVPVSVLAGILK